MAYRYNTLTGQTEDEYGRPVMLTSSAVMPEFVVSTNRQLPSGANLFGAKDVTSGSFVGTPTRSRMVAAPSRQPIVSKTSPTRQELFTVQPPPRARARSTMGDGKPTLGESIADPIAQKREDYIAQIHRLRSGGRPVSLTYEDPPMVADIPQMQELGGIQQFLANAAPALETINNPFTRALSAVGRNATMQNELANRRLLGRHQLETQQSSALADRINAMNRLKKMSYETDMAGRKARIADELLPYELRYKGALEDLKTRGMLADIGLKERLKNKPYFAPTREMIGTTPEERSRNIEIQLLKKQYDVAVEVGEDAKAANLAGQIRELLGRAPAQPKEDDIFSGIFGD